MSTRKPDDAEERDTSPLFKAGPQPTFADIPFRKLREHDAFEEARTSAWNDAIEEAAKLLDARANELDYEGGSYVVELCAEAVRALKRTP